MVVVSKANKFCGTFLSNLVQFADSLLLFVVDIFAPVEYYPQTPKSKLSDEILKWQEVYKDLRQH